jgi:cytoskeleton protein RodZ
MAALPLSSHYHTMRAAEAAEVNESMPPTEHVEGASPESAEMHLHERIAASFGMRLASARERLGLSRTDVASRLKLPVRLVGRLEADDYEGLTQGVFLQGYLASYARLVGIPVEQAADVAAAHVEAAPLVATGAVSRSRYLIDRYSVSATYLVLTAIIVVPAVWLATHGGLEQNLARTTPLDVALPSASVSAPLETPEGGQAQGSADGTLAVVPPPPASIDPPPVIASMAPFTQQVGSAAPPEATVARESGHTLSLELVQPSWVEITAADGSKVEYSMLGVGTHEYRSDGPLSVRIGNVQGAEIRTDGERVDLVPFRRGNVAHVKLFADGGPVRVAQ